MSSNRSQDLRETGRAVPSRNERSFLLSGNHDCSDHEPGEAQQGQTGGELPLIDSKMFYDLLMEQQEQM